MVVGARIVLASCCRPARVAGVMGSIRGHVEVDPLIMYLGQLLRVIRSVCSVSLLIRSISLLIRSILVHFYKGRGNEASLKCFFIRKFTN